MKVRAKLVLELGKNLSSQPISFEDQIWGEEGGREGERDK